MGRRREISNIIALEHAGRIPELDALIKEFLEDNAETLLTISHIHKLAIDRGLYPWHGTGNKEMAKEYEKLETMKDTYIVPLFKDFRDSYILRMLGDTDGSITAHFQRAISDRLEYDPWLYDNCSWGRTRGTYPQV